MSSVEQAARALGKAIQSDPRYIAYQQTKAANDADTSLQEEIQEYNLKNMSYQRELEKPEGLRNAEKMQQLEEIIQTLYVHIIENTHMTAFDNAKQEMEGMMQEINAIIMLCVNGEDPDSCHPDLTSCTGNCSSCGGCH